jgi:hypothetical protein
MVGRLWEERDIGNSVLRVCRFLCAIQILLGRDNDHLLGGVQALIYYRFPLVIKGTF